MPWKKSNTRGGKKPDDQRESHRGSGSELSGLVMLPCPHCGTTPTIEDATIAEGCSFVECPKCSAGGPGVSLDKDTLEPKPMEAIEYWNTRLAVSKDGCPFCNYATVGYEFSSSQGFIRCTKCGAVGPDDEHAADPHCDIDAAYEAWQKRAT